MSTLPGVENIYSRHLRGEKDISLEGRKNVNHSSEIQICVFDDLFSTLPGGETLSPHPSQGGENIYTWRNRLQ